MKKNIFLLTSIMGATAFSLLILKKTTSLSSVRNPFLNASNATRYDLKSNKLIKEMTLMSELHNRMDDIINRLKQEGTKRKELLRPAPAMLQPTLKKVEKWMASSKETPASDLPKSPIDLPRHMQGPAPVTNTTPMTQNEKDAATMRAKIELNMLSEQISQVQIRAMVDSPFYEYLSEEFQALAEAMDDINAILNMDIDDKKMSDLGLHDYEAFLSKREQLLRKFKK